jgi:hypothetical protein
MMSATGYSKGTGDKALHRLPVMTFAQVRQAKAAEKAAADAFFAVAATVKPGSKVTAEHAKLQAAMVTATKARQAAMTAYAATLVG